MVGATLDPMLFHLRLDASMTPEHNSIGHFLIDKPSQNTDLVDEIEIKNFTVEPTSAESLRELSIS